MSRGRDDLHSYQVFAEQAEPWQRRFSKALVICNPFSGGRRGLRRLDDVSAVFRRRGLAFDVEYTAGPRDAKHKAETLALDGYDVICPIGGDGTVHEIVNGLLRRADGRRIAIGVLPSGSGNTFAYDLGIDNHIMAAELICEGFVRDVDVVSITPPASATAEAAAQPAPHAYGAGPVYSINMIGWGLPAAVLGLANRMRCCGKAQYNLAAYRQLLSNPAYTARLELSTAPPAAAAEAAGAMDAEVESGASAVADGAGAGSGQAGEAGAAAAAREAEEAKQGGGAGSATAALHAAGDAAAAVEMVALQVGAGAEGGEEKLDGESAEPAQPPEVHAGDWVMVQVQNTVHMGDHMPFCPDAKLDDGRMDVVLVPRMGRCALISTMEHAKRGRHVQRNRRLVYAQPTELVLTPGPAMDGERLRLNVDGELIEGVGAPCVLRTLRGAITVVVKGSRRAQ